MNTSKISAHSHRAIVEKHAVGFIPRLLVNLRRAKRAPAEFAKDTTWQLGKNLFQGNEFEGGMLGARMITGADPGIGTYLGGGLLFDAARPAVMRGIKSLDNRLLNRFTDAGRYGDIRKGIMSGHDKFKQVSKWAPAAEIAGVVQQANVGFNQFDPATSIAEGRQQAIDDVARTLGWDSGQSMGADVRQYKPLLNAGKALAGGLSSGMNLLTSPFNNRAIAALPEDQLNGLVTQAINSYGEGFLRKAPRDQAAIIRDLQRTSGLSGGAY
jgi:hypothetical protein